METLPSPARTVLDPESDPVPQELHHLIVDGELDRLVEGETGRDVPPIEGSLPPHRGERRERVDLGTEAKAWAEWNPSAATPVLQPERTIAPSGWPAEPLRGSELLIPVLAGAASAIATVVVLGSLVLSFL